ncbi:MAG: helix-turn-helix domain-containing protein [Gammaproteobacteria bacterium]|nr:helix-turn-helix domain-containing protein [Gammaproteobacteria bacterium]
MADGTDNRGISKALRQLVDLGVVPAVAGPLEKTLERSAEALLTAVTRDVDAFSASANPDVLPELDEHIRSHLHAVRALLAGGSVPDFDFVIRHAERRAVQKFPLDAILQAYQQMHRLVADWVRDAALATADSDATVNRVVATTTSFTIEYIGVVSTLVISRYVRHTRVLAEAEGDRRTALLNTMLDGYDESDRQAASLLRRAGYLQQRQSYCVAVAQSVKPEEMQSPPRAQRMLESVTAAVAAAPLRAIGGIRDNLVVVIISGTRRRSGWTPARSAVADRAFPGLRRVGPAALIGLSSDVPSTSHIPRAAQEARLALDNASVANRVVRYSDIPFKDLLVARAGRELVAALPPWLDKFSAMDRRAKGALSDTLRAYADCNMNVLKAAERLAVHPNTIYARIQRIDDATGMNILRYHALTEMLLALDCAGSER